MRRKLLALLMLIVGMATGATASPWRVSLPDTVVIQGSTALLRDISATPVPAGAGNVVIQAGAEPNTVVPVSRQLILRRLVIAGLSAGVVFDGPETCSLVFAGRELGADTLTREIRAALQALVPPTAAGAPDSWFEFVLPEVRFAAAGDWTVKIDRHQPLEPGRNLVQVHLSSGAHRESFSTSVVLHSFGETARAVHGIDRDMALNESMFSWEWQDLAYLTKGVGAGRQLLAGSSATRSIAAGDLLREADLKETPLILAGDPVELMVVRGQVAVTVRAFARQPGCLGQTIPVRNELTGRLVNARVAGPGLVEWRK